MWMGEASVPASLVDPYTSCLSPPLLLPLPSLLFFSTTPSFGALAGQMAGGLCTDPTALHHNLKCQGLLSEGPLPG